MRQARARRRKRLARWGLARWYKPWLARTDVIRALWCPLCQCFHLSALRREDEVLSAQAMPTPEEGADGQ